MPSPPISIFPSIFGGRANRSLSLPSSESDVYSGTSPHSETLELRALTLWQMAQGQPDILVLPARSLITRIDTPEEIRAMGIRLKRDEDHSPDLLIENLGASGYVREDPIQNVGQFSVRGGIIDVWPPNASAPARIEFFGDTVDSIREFDAETQLSTNQLKEIDLAPMREFAATAEDFRDWAFFARERFSGETSARALKDRTVFADEGESFHGWEWLFPILRERRASVFDYLDFRENGVLVIDEPVLVEDCLSNLYKHLDARYAETLGAGEIGLPPDELFLTIDELRKDLERRKRLELRALGSSAAKTDEEFSLEASDLSDKLFLFPAAKNSGEKSAEIEMQSRSARKYYGKLAEFAEELKKENKPLMVLQTTGLAERLSDILRDYDVVLSEENVVIGDLSSGFELPLAGLVIQTENELFGELPEMSSTASSIGPKKKRSRTKAFISDFRDLKPGDFVVHVDHGIGRFEGLQTIELASGTGSSGREFMLLIYADNAKLFVPVERLDLVSRYSSRRRRRSRLSTVSAGSAGRKQKPKPNARCAIWPTSFCGFTPNENWCTGFAFSADAPWQDEFEDAFPYRTDRRPGDGD